MREEGREVAPAPGQECLEKTSATSWEHSVVPMRPQKIAYLCPPHLQKTGGGLSLHLVGILLSCFGVKCAVEIFS